MALSSAIVWEVRTAGATTAGGGFKTGASGTDWSQQNSAQYTLTGLTTAAANAIILTASAANDMVGNIIQITGGTNFITGFYEIVSVSAGVNINVDRNCTTAAGAAGTGNIGGALSTLSKAATGVVAGNIVYIKAGTYSETLTITTSGSAASDVILWSGYNASRNDFPTETNRPLINGGSVRTNCISLGTVDGNIFEYLRMASATGDNVLGGSSGTATTIFRYCKSSSAGGYGFNTSANFMLFGCEANLNTSDGVLMNALAGPSYIWGCSFHNNTGRGFNFNPGDCCGQVGFTLSYANGNHGFTVGASFSFISCTSTANTGASTDGFNFAETNNRSYPNVMVVNNISQGNGRDGFRRVSSTQQYIGVFDYNDYQGNVGSGLTNITAGPHDSTASPQFSSSTDFGIGIALKAIGYPGAFIDGNSTGYLDIGAVQRKEITAGGSFTFVR